ncbi:MAG TPA: response regulator, partial [Bacteroidetes bacterium]|nr:response regulator [Bacteroidota bacterium]HEX03980.1 response regulator [Bacteroidota bacterium]
MQEFEPGVGSGNILLVDDESTVLETSSMMLELLGFSVTGHTSPQSALDSLKDCTPIDVIFTDLDMPEMNGREFANAVRAISADIPVIVVSG